MVSLSLSFSEVFVNVNVISGFRSYVFPELFAQYAIQTDTERRIVSGRPHAD